MAKPDMGAHPNVSRTYASFRVWGKHLDPAEITTRLGINPHDSFKAGDKRGERGNWKHGHWEITSEGQITSTDLEAHIGWILDILETAKAQIIELTHEAEIKADIFCFWEVKLDENGIAGGIDFSPTILGRLAALNLTLGLDVYFALDDKQL